MFWLDICQSVNTSLEVPVLSFETILGNVDGSAVVSESAVGGIVGSEPVRKYLFED